MNVRKRRRMRARALWPLLFFALMAVLRPSGAQQWQPVPVDPTVHRSGVLQSAMHQPLPEQFIWTSESGNADAPRFLRTTFELSVPPPHATFYLAGPREAQVFLNGQRVGDFSFDQAETVIGPPVYEVEVAAFLRAGTNIITVRASAARKTAPWMPEFAYTKGAIVAKILAAAPGVDGPALLISNTGWKASGVAASGWEAPGFDDSGWPVARSLGGIEGDIDLFQSNADAGLYRWPGYDGISPFLSHLPFAASAVLEVRGGGGRFEGLENLTTDRRGPLTIIQSSPGADPDSAPSLVLDFGREMNGRLEIVSDSSQFARLTLQTGESREEAVRKPFLGVRELYLPPGAKVHGPKGAFRYVRLQFFGEGELRLRTVGVDGVYYPVEYRGSFRSSDPLLNRIWEIGAYTAHLCMQDDIWDAPKRDRARWMGDLSVIGNVINHVFSDHFLMEDTLTRLNPAPVTSHVNGIPGYSAYWVIGLADYYRQFGSTTYLQSVLPNLRALLAYMEGDLDEKSLFANRRGGWVFVDWSQDLHGDTPEARRATQFLYYKAFRDGAFLLRAAGDPSTAQHFEERAGQIRDAAQHYLLEPATQTFGSRWQSNALAVYSGLATFDQQAAIHSAVFAALDADKLPDYDISPYNYNFFLYAMSKTGDRQIALSWIRKYWGGMLAEGATSFWEGYDTRWPKDDFHASLKADDGKGYFVSLAHGWSSGPTAWMMDNVLGVTPDEPGFRRVLIRPDLLDLNSADGEIPAPQGPIHVDLKKADGRLIATLDLPPGTHTRVLFPVANVSQRVLVNNHPRAGEAVEDGKRKEIQLAPGHYVLHAQ